MWFNQCNEAMRVGVEIVYFVMRNVIDDERTAASSSLSIDYVCKCHSIAWLQLIFNSFCFAISLRLNWCANDTFRRKFSLYAPWLYPQHSTRIAVVAAEKATKKLLLNGFINQRKDFLHFSMLIRLLPFAARIWMLCTHWYHLECPLFSPSALSPDWPLWQYNFLWSYFGHRMLNSISYIVLYIWRWHLNDP